MKKFSKNDKLIILILLINFLSVAHSEKNDNTVGLNCTYTTSKEDANGTTHNDTRKLLMVNKCAEGYENEEIIRKCEHLISPNRSEYSKLFSPVMSSFTNVTYWNRYCSMCNNDNETNWDRWFVSWKTNFRWLDSSCGGHASEIQLSDANRLNELTQTFISEGMELKANYYLDSARFECFLEKNWPIKLLNHVAPCVIVEFQVGQDERLITCQYVEENHERICREMRLFMEGFYFDKNGKSIYYDKWSELDFTGGEYVVKSGYDDVFYFCKRPEMINRLRSWINIFVCIISIIFITIYLVINFNKPYFQNFLNKMIFSYLLGSIGMYVVLTFIYLSFQFQCVAFYLALFFWFFHFFWTMLIFIEYCYSIYILSDNKDISESARHKRYVIYCLLGFVLPISVPIVYYFRVLEANENHCPVIPGHLAVVVPCICAKDSRAENFMIILLNILNPSFSFFMPVLFVLVLAFVHIYFECGSGAGSRWLNDRNSIVLMKMTLIMTLHWIIYKLHLAYWSDDFPAIQSPHMDLIYHLCVNLQGVLVVFVFSIKKSMLTNILKKCGCKSETGSQLSGDNVVALDEQSHPLSAQS